MKTGSLMIVLFIIPCLLYSWEQTGPAGVDTGTTVAFDHDDGTDMLYLGSARDHLFRIDYENGIWTYLPTPVEENTLMSVTAHNGVILMGRDDHVLRSFDDGESWEFAEEGISLGPSLSPSVLRICEMAPNYVFGKFAGNVWYRSEDIGSTWQQLVVSSCNQIDFYGTDLTVLIGAYSLLKSTDFCESWDEILIDLPTGFYTTCFKIIDADTYVVAGIDLDFTETVFISTNGGFDWENINFGNPLGMPRDIEYHNGSIYVSCMRTNWGEGGVFRLNLVDDQWQRVGDEMMRSNSGYFIELAEDLLFLASYREGIFQLDLDTSLCQNLNPDNVFEKSIYDIDVYSDNNELIANNGFAYVSHDQGYSWSRIDSVYSIWDIERSQYNPDDMIALRRDHGVRMSYDGGSTWDDANEGILEQDRNTLSAAHFIDENTILIAGVIHDPEPGSISYIYRSEDSGQTWEKIYENVEGNQITLSGLAIVDDMIYTAMLGKGVQRSSDLGSSWETVFYFEDGFFHDLSYDTVNGIFYVKAYIPGTTGRDALFQSYDTVEWNEITSVFTENYRISEYMINPGEPNEILCATYKKYTNAPAAPHLMFSVDFGSSWEEIWLDFLDEETVIASLAAIPETDELLIGPLYHSIYRISLDQLSTDSHEIPAGFITSLSNYPNPFNPSTVIRFQLSAVSKINLSIYNIRGQLVNTLINSNMSAGNHSVFWDGADQFDKPVHSGIYFYRIQADKETQTKKMILLR